ncbi:hypothetical protein ACTA71_006755, partial [Dictyostelium dimigraforme]
CYQSIQFH